MTRARDLNPVRLRREELNMLLVELAAKIGRSPAFVSVCEGGFIPAHNRRVQIATALDTAPETLWPQEYS
jgi:hypothetical protein